MLDRFLIGKTYPIIFFNVKIDRLKLFAKATGQTNPLYTDIEFALKEGHPSLLAPPTFLTVVNYEQEDPYHYLKDLKINLGKFLHTNQEYNYFSLVYAGDSIEMKTKITDIFDKKEGKLNFIIFTSTYTNQNKVVVAESKTTLVVRFF